MLEFWCLAGTIFTIAFIIAIIATSCTFVGEKEIPISVAAVIIILGMVSTLCWSQANCAEAHTYTYYATDRQEKMIEMLAEMTSEDEFYVAGVVILCDEELSIAEMATSIDGSITSEDAESLERIIEEKLKKISDED